jgi:hypothetical protein
MDSTSSVSKQIGANKQLSLADEELWLHQPKKFQVNLLPLN